MFTGIIQQIGRVKSAVARGGNMAFDIEADKIADKLKIGDSVSINGACQTVVAGDHKHFRVEAVKETLLRTNLGSLRSGSPINLELPMSISDLLHGHLVQGHIDCTGSIIDIGPIEGSTIVSIGYPAQYGRYLIEKGSIAVDGVSLTITEISQGSFKVSLIPHTVESSIIKYRKVGEAVNLEFDMIAKYIEKMTPPHEGKITIDFLKERGF